MANIEKKKEKLKLRIEELEFELRNTLQKKTIGKAINIFEYNTKILELKTQLSTMGK